MPNWSEVLDEIQQAENNHVPNSHDTVRHKYLALLAAKTGRNIVAYYSGWLNPAVGNSPGLSINDDDKSGFMTAIHGMDRSKGLDLILHTPGGDIAAAESIVFYLRAMFGTDVRVIVPQISMSAGTMIACSAKSIVLGKQSSLGPIDPQLGGVSAPAVLDEFKRAIEEIRTQPASLPLWQTIIGKYHPTFLDSCHRAIDWSKNMVQNWLETGMFQGDKDAAEKAKKIVDVLADHDGQKTHARHLHFDKCEDIGLKIERLEADGELQDLVLTVHHCYMHTCALMSITKIIENGEGVSRIQRLNVPTPGPVPQV
ncbi:Serine protease [Paraburkholderia tropica]|uniref:SDH family Clp fold serine proteinase n=1 Tax=Paraburkholderia tropica TaxID=92647 RepID=UPI001CB45EA4|nr:hypothetical protein [Paraburkholderia tropica]CAG9194563.1 Serine protease [Paraburkholderia tropica]